MVKPVRLKTRVAENRNEIVEVLRDMLRSARRGQITGIAIAATRTDAECTTDYAFERPLALLGAIEMLKSDIQSTVRMTEVEQPKKKE